ncbi:hypothetical protein [Rhodopirellula baltica]
MHSLDEFTGDEWIATIRDVFACGATLERDIAVRHVFNSLREQGLDAKRLKTAIRETIAGHFRAAVRRGVISRVDQSYEIDCHSIDDYPRELLVSSLLSAIGRTWHAREDAIRATARHLGFRRTGTKIKAAMKSAINAGIRQGKIERDGPHNIRKA